MSEPEIDHRTLDLLILARLCTYSRKARPSFNTLQRDLGSFLEHRLDRRDLQRVLEQRLAALRAAGLVDAERLAATQAGSAHLAQHLGTSRLPAWPALKTRLAALSVGWAPHERVRLDADRLRARVIAKRHGLRTKKSAPTLTEVLDAWLWHQLGIETDEKFTPARARAAVLRRLLGADSVPSETRRQGSWMAAQSLGIASREIAPLTQRLLQRAVIVEPGRDTVSANAKPISAAPSQPPQARTDVGALARSVQQVADDTTGAGRYNDRKVFISAIWHALAGRPEVADMSLAQFKRHLVEANARGLLRLHRADLLGAHDDRVETSEIRDLNATFHFVESRMRRSA